MASRLQKLKFALMLRMIGIYKHLTLGARTAVIVEGQVLLVRHGYSPGWQLPGGGVDPGETVEEAARREVLEETGYRVTGRMRLFGVYHSQLYTQRDHVTLFVTDRVEEERPFVPNREIAEVGWFDLDTLPDTVSPATQRRLEEIAGRAEIDAKW